MMVPILPRIKIFELKILIRPDGVFVSHYAEVDRRWASGGEQLIDGLSAGIYQPQLAGKLLSRKLIVR